jgi:lipoyl-dependent peroxiredoxin
MPVRSARAEWNGDLKSGNGTMKLGSGAWEGSYSFPSRFEEGTGSNPEELIGAAHAGCFSMALSGGLSKAGFQARRIQTEARVHLQKGDDGFKIARVELTTEAEVPGIEEKTFQEEAAKAKAGCPVSKALAGVQIDLQATLK